MSDNILRGIISITAPNLPATANAVNRSVAGMERTLVKAGAAGQSFGVGAARASASLKPLANSSNQATLALGNLGRVAQDAPFGFIGIANNLNPLLESFQRLKATTGSTGGALKALGSSLTGAGGLGLALSVASSLAIVFGGNLSGASKKVEEHSDAVKTVETNYDRFLSKLSEVSSSVASEATKLSILASSYNDTSLSLKQRGKVLEEIQSKYPEYLSNLKKEGDYYNSLNNIISDNIDFLAKNAEVKALLPQLDNILKGVINSQVELNRLRRQQVGGEDGFFAMSDADFKEEERRLKSQIDKGINEIKRAKTGLSIIAGGGKSLVDILFPDTNKEKEVKAPKVKVEPTKIEIPESVQAPTIKVKGLFDFEAFRNSFLGNQSRFQSEFDEVTAAQNLKIKVSPLIEPQFAKDNRSFAENYLSQVKTLVSAISDVLTPAFSSFFNTVANGGNAFKAFAQAAIQALVGLISKLATTAVLSLIVSSISGGGAAFGAPSNKFGDIFKVLSGFGRLDGARAAGGPVSAGRSYLVGENGPEIFNPGTSGNIIPNNRINSFSGGGISSMMGRVVFEISGNKLIGVLANGSRSQRSLV